MADDRFEAPDYYQLDELLTDEHKLIRDTVRSWVKAEVSPIAPITPVVPIVPPAARQKGWVRNTKNVLCGPPKEVIKGVQSYGEAPFMLWEDPVLKSTVMVFRNLERDTLTLIENPTPELSCILSAGTKIHIEGPFLQQKSREVKKSTDLKVLQIKNE